MSNTNDTFQVDYLPEEVWKNIDTIVMTRLFQKELVVEKQKEREVLTWEDLLLMKPARL